MGSANGLALTALVIRPLRMHWVQTRMRLISPDGVETLTLFRLGRNFRLVIPVTLVPTPPKYLATPRISICCPDMGFLPQTSHSRAISRTFQTVFLSVFTPILLGITTSEQPQAGK